MTNRCLWSVATLAGRAEQRTALTYQRQRANDSLWLTTECTHSTHHLAAADAAGAAAAVQCQAVLLNMYLCQRPNQVTWVIPLLVCRVVSSVTWRLSNVALYCPAWAHTPSASSRVKEWRNTITALWLAATLQQIHNKS